jgi:hypothetical protein
VKNFSNQKWFNGLAFLVDIPHHIDGRGMLTPFDFEGLPFRPQRIFTVSNVPVGTVRGKHGHLEGTQLLFCIQGEIQLLLRYKDQEVAICLKPCTSGLLFKSGIWCQQTYSAPDSVMLAFADSPYNPASYFTGES